MKMHVLVCAILATLLLPPSPAMGQWDESIYVGLRRSEFGFKEKRADDAWWAARASEFAGRVQGRRKATPVIIQIVSTYISNGTTRFGFQRPASFKGSTKKMIFRPGAVDHGRALSTYEKMGVKAIIQLEPGSADVGACLEIARAAFGPRPSIIGYGVDAEWYLKKDYRAHAGRPIKDADVEKWVDAVVSWDPDYTLFLKHWRPDHMPARYRHPKLWFLSDSQQFNARHQLMHDFKTWAEAFSGEYVGYQFGYESDQRWWGKLRNPPIDLSHEILRKIPNTRYLFWVDFTADKIDWTLMAKLR
ncbi:MAG: hypothetical protein GY859_29835 [Desulfobacterales bacterium]|nr:hypothetical protein [Desulfobacterales bacterium]